MPKVYPPPGISPFSNEGGCSLDWCPVEWSIYGYRPSLPANVVFAALFGLIGLGHCYLGWRWRTWGFTSGMLLGCVTEVIGYAGRVLLWKDPFDFNAFMIQIVCLTIAPVFFTASIYVTLSKTIIHLDPSVSRIPPKFFYYIFIPFDIVCLALQAAGGAMSTGSDSSTQTGVNISMAGLALQVAVLVIFAAAYADYMTRYSFFSGRNTNRARGFDWRFIVFLVGMSASTLLVLTRCAYRVAELKDGYTGTLIAEEIPFIVLEGVVIAFAAIALFFGHPGLVFDREEMTNLRKKSLVSDCEQPVSPEPVPSATEPHQCGYV